MKRIGNRTLIFENTPVIKGYASVAGKKEYEGPLGKFFDRIIFDPYNGMETFEDAESSFQAEAVSLAIEKSGVTTDEIDYIFAGDLLNQCTGSSFGIRDFQLPFLGQYGACSTMGQGLIMSAVFTDSGAARNAVCATSSHFCAAERQYRFPLEYGSVRTPTAQWTVTQRCINSRGYSRKNNGLSGHRPKQYGRRHGTCCGYNRTIPDWF